MSRTFTWVNVKLALRNIPRLLREIWTLNPLWFLGVTVIMLVQGLIPPGTLAYTRRLVDSLAGGEPGWFFLAMVAVLVGLGHLLGDVRGALVAVVGRRLGIHLKHKILEKALAIEQIDLEKSENQDTLQNANQAVTQSLTIQVLDALMAASRELVTLVGLIALLGAVHWSLPFLVIGASVPTLVIGMKYGGARYQVLRSQAPRVRVVTYLGSLITNPVTSKEVRTHGLGAHLRRRWLHQATELTDEESALQWKRTWAGLGGQAVSIVGYVLGLGIIMQQVLAGNASLGAAVAAVTAVSQAYTYVEGVVNNLASIFSQSLMAQNLFEWLDLPASPPTGPVAELPAAFGQGIRFENVTFCYPGSPKPSLDGVTLHLKPGETVALVGENGAGKTTLVKLLAGLYKPDAGQITVDGIPLTDVDLQQWRERIAVCFQDFVRYQLTAGENITLGRPDWTVQAERLQAACVMTGAGNVVEQLPDGLQTLVGSELGGRELSGGQWQKLAVARAFFRDAPVVVLDEPAASLDPRAEAEIFAQFAELARGKICLFISHRMGMARMADRIVVVREGRLVEEGTHEELVRKGGEYSRMYRLQAQWYQD